MRIPRAAVALALSLAATALPCPSARAAAPVVASILTPSGNGRWDVSSAGGVFASGDARFFGSLGATRLNRPIVGVAATSAGDGYWLVASDGGVFSFGAARFFGSLGAVRLNQPIAAMAARPQGDGYWLAARDGGVFTFGRAPYLGGTGAHPPSSPITAIAASTSGAGYRLRTADGRTFPFGDAPPAPGCTIFPADNPWNTDVAAEPVHPRSAAWVASIGGATTLHPDVGSVYGIPFVEVGARQPRVPVSFGYADESDPGPYPIPPTAPVEGGGDRHVLVVDRQTCRLWELFDASTSDGGRSWRAGSGATWDLRSNALRPDGWTSADAAGLPIFPGLIRYDEVVAGHIGHALRFTAQRTQRGYVHPATHFASSITDPDVPPMGARFRLKATHSCAAYATEVQVVCAALKRYGMFLADNGSNWYLTGAPDRRWSDDRLRDLRRIPGSAFEVVDTGASAASEP